MRGGRGGGLGAVQRKSEMEKNMAKLGQNIEKESLELVSFQIHDNTLVKNSIRDF